MTCPPLAPLLFPHGTMGGCFSKPKPVEVKIEVVIPEKERSKEEMSPNGKASPLIYKVNGTARHYHLEEHPIASSPYHNPKDMVEASVCHVKDLENGQMREVDLGCGKALLIKESGEFHAVGHKCPHYGAPLVKGVLSKGRVRCPWHGACFNIGTGDIEDFPGLDSLPRFQVKIEKEKVYIRASKQALQTQRRTKMMAKCISLSNYNLGSTNVLIIGAGAAGLVCAETLRQEGFSDRIVMCTMDRHLPYDRPKLSKGSCEPACAVRSCSYGCFANSQKHLLPQLVSTSPTLSQQRRNRSPDRPLVSMDSQPEQIALRPKEFFCTYDIEVLTEMQVAAVDIKSKIAVFKDGFKMEYNKLLIATGNTPKALSCKGKEMENVFNIRTPEDANHVVKLATSKNVVIVGASFLGAVPATGFLKQSGINIDSKGFIVVNKMMQTNIPGVFAAGDAVTFPLALRNNKKVNVPHWQMAHMHGRIAALNMLAHGTEISTVPYLWTAMFGKSIRYAGHAEGFDDVVIQGDLDELKFVAFYTKSDEVVAVASMNYDPIVSKVAEVLAAGRTIRKRDVELFVRHEPETCLGYQGKAPNMLVAVPS
ncbi:apoptosis-inducing factor 3 isoform X11 [Myiozetetes cayanensis]|uniref:apoptosis-inducing factor 3 isoform X11 n=1 Tax=Myiozetetes cayanensis TaxID=478635 RepID=UPI00215F9BBA|nr:apoptosis-inducing factor 3 isoform X11 [Myiozetetes cayanensis]